MLRGIGIVAGLALVGLAGYVVHEARGDRNVSFTAGDKKERVFEMRTYISNPGKMKALEARFRDHTNKLFEKHGMTIIGFWKPVEQKEAKKGATKIDHENTLIYILAYPSLDAAKKSWDDFKTDPDWVAAKKASEVNGGLVAKVESVFMSPTDYSPIK